MGLNEIVRIIQNGLVVSEKPKEGREPVHTIDPGLNSDRCMRPCGDALIADYCVERGFPVVDANQARFTEVFVAQPSLNAEPKAQTQRI